ncbi:hypothetical protein [Pseudohalioglobus lutimaris]|nr:hypothetical protein [Pseudohalioglobus lutimaris]
MKKQQPVVTSITRARFPQKRKLLGLRGRQLGDVECCGIDLRSGEVKYIELTTPGQNIRIAWCRVGIDEPSGAFRLLGDAGYN